MKKIFTIIYLFQVAFCQAQGVRFTALQKIFVSEYCTCLQSNPNLPAKSILYNKSDTCIKAIITENIADFNKVIEEFTFDPKLSDYENGRKIGKYLVYDSTDELVNQCPFYERTLKRYIKEEGDKLGATPEKIDTAIKTFKEYELKIENDAQGNMVYQILGVLYYINAAYPEALNYFEKANTISSSTITKSFILMIKKYDLKK